MAASMTCTRSFTPESMPVFFLYDWLSLGVFGLPQYAQCVYHVLPPRKCGPLSGLAKSGLSASCSPEHDFSSEHNTTAVTGTYTHHTKWVASASTAHLHWTRSELVRQLLAAAAASSTLSCCQTPSNSLNHLTKVPLLCQKTNQSFPLGHSQSHLLPEWKSSQTWKSACPDGEPIKTEKVNI